MIRPRRAKPLSVDEWIGFFDRDGRISSEKELRRRVFYGVCARVRVRVRASQ